MVVTAIGALVMVAHGATGIAPRGELDATPYQRSELQRRYADEAMAPEVAAARLLLDQIVEPPAIRTVLRSMAVGNTLRLRHDDLPQ